MEVIDGWYEAASGQKKNRPRNNLAVRFTHCGSLGAWRLVGGARWRRGGTDRNGQEFTQPLNLEALSVVCTLERASRPSVRTRFRRVVVPGRFALCTLLRLLFLQFLLLGDFALMLFKGIVGLGHEGSVWAGTYSLGKHGQRTNCASD